MEQKLQLTFNGDKPVNTDFNVTDTLLVNFSRCIRNKEYIFTFVNDSNYESLTFTFHSNLEIDCYFEFTKADGKKKFVGYRYLKEKEFTVDIKDCKDFSIVIPREKNTDVCTALTLAHLEAK